MSGHLEKGGKKDYVVCVDIEVKVSSVTGYALGFPSFQIEDII